MTAIEPTTIHNTFVIERSFPQSPERVFAAFAESASKRRWYAGSDHEILEFAMDFRVGGIERFHYRFKEGHPVAGSEIVNESSYQDIVPGKRIVLTSRMSLNAKPILVAVLTLEFVPSARGTDLLLTNQGAFVEWPMGAELIQQGWNKLVDRLGTELAQ